MRGRFLVLVPLALLGAACGGPIHFGHSLVGKWTVNLSGQQTTFQFRDDGTMGINTPGMYPMDIDGNYTLDGVNLSFDLTKAKLRLGNREMQKLVDEQLRDHKLSHYQTVLTWKDDDRVELSGASSLPIAGNPAISAANGTVTPGSMRGPQKPNAKPTAPDVKFLLKRLKVLPKAPDEKA